MSHQTIQKQSSIFKSKTQVKSKLKIGYNLTKKKHGKCEQKTLEISRMFTKLKTQ